MMDDNEKKVGFEGKDQSFEAEYIAGGDQTINLFQVSDKIDNVDNYNCPNCDTNPQEEQLNKSEIVCLNCNSKYYVYTPITKVTAFKSLAPEENNFYRRLLFQIEAQIELENYEKVDQLCDRAIDMASEESVAWEYKALTYYFSNSKNSIIVDELKTIKKYFKIAKRADKDSNSIDMIGGRIVYHLDFSIKHRLNLIWNGLDNEKNRKNSQN